MSSSAPWASQGPLDVFKALGDNTRYAIYLELARASRPLATAEVAGTLGLHVNTVRPHLERLRDIGVLRVEVDARGGVGRPQHRYALAPDAPSLGLEPPVFPLAAELFLRLAAASGARGDDAADVGAEQGLLDADRQAARRPGQGAIDALMDRLAELGFDPVAAPSEHGATVAFTHCPFEDLARAHTELVCGLHRGLVEGFLSGCGTGSVEAFRTLADRVPCQVDIDLGHAGQGISP